jgi:hypothetical protein
VAGIGWFKVRLGFDSISVHKGEDNIKKSDAIYGKDQVVQKERLLACN